MIRIKRVYEQATEDDGFRILVDRIWPRGLTKSRVNVNLWLKEIAPSNALRKWFSHDPEKWEEFKKKYGAELREKQELVRRIKQAERDQNTVTLLYSAKDEQYNNAVALITILKMHGRQVYT